MAQDKFPSGLTKYDGQNLLDWQNWLADNERLDAFIDLVKQQLLPTGTILSYGGVPDENNDPPGFLYLMPGGRLVSREKYPKLFEVLGTTYGSGDGKTTFKLPDLAGRFPLGYDANLGAKGGKKNHALTTAELPQHIHPLTYYTDSISLNSGAIGYRLLFEANAGNGTAELRGNSTGSNLTHENMPPYLTLAYIIKA